MLAQLPDWASCLFDEGPRYFAIHGGRGSAKSRSVATALLLRAAQKPLRILCAREIQKSIRDSVKRLLDDEIARLGLGEFYTSLETEIRGANGSLFIFAGLRSNIESIKSMEGIDIVWVEEAQTVSQGSLDTLIPTIRKPGSQIIFTWNPKGAADPVDAMFRGETVPPGTVCKQVNWQDNPWFPEVLRVEKDYDAKRDPGRYAHVWGGAYLTRSEACVFSNWRVEEFEAPPDAHHRFGADWGYAVDPTVLVRCHIVGRTLYVDYEAYAIGCAIVDTPDLFLTVPAAEKWPIVADSSRPETIAHMRAHGFPKIMPATKGPGSVDDGIEWLRSLDIVVHPRCEHIVSELTTYNYKTDPITGAVLPVLQDKNNHCIAEGQPVLTARGYVPVETVTTDDMVLTRGGWRPVIFAGVTDYDREIVKVTTTVGEFLCTPDHEVWTSKGFVRADALRYDDEVIGDASWPTLSESSGVGSCGAATPTASTCRTGGTSSACPATSRCGCIAQCGRLCTAQCQPATTSTTSMATQETTTSPILSASLHSSTPTSMSGATSAERSSACFSMPSDHSQRSGTPATPGELCTSALAHSRTATSSLNPSPASSAAPSSLLAHSATEISSAPTSASQPPAALLASTTSTVIAVSAGSSFEPTDTARSRLAPGRVVRVQEHGRCERVYDLTVDEHHEFIVGGVLVSNCIDALRYACESARRAPVKKPASVTPRPTLNHW